MKPMRTCFDCLNAVKHPDYPGSFDEPPMAACAECDVDEVSEEVQELYEHERPEKCGCFQPEIIEECGNCKMRMDTPRWLWPIWAMGNLDGVPCCCHGCKRELQAKIDDGRVRRLPMTEGWRLIVLSVSSPPERS